MKFDSEFLSGQVGDLKWLEGKTGKKQIGAEDEDPAVLEKLMVTDYMQYYMVPCSLKSQQGITISTL